MAVLESEILARAKAWGITGALTPTARMELGKQIQEEKERAAGVLMNERYVKAIEDQNTATKANTAELMAWNARLAAALNPA